MIKLRTSEGEVLWVAPDKVVALSAVKTQAHGGPPIIVLGTTMVFLVSAPPVIVKGTPDEIAMRFDNGGFLPA